ncbi:BQ2448_2917 [Microbotryum intermedium]|uniref:BQ2448_2917 protein n=1 Tax=Microbotryum intermedium TaxID=269621 RepID=A0A238FEU3_9BASI|nr:BQ2448_2917 [Microbotryum intermedium]
MNNTDELVRPFQCPGVVPASMQDEVHVRVLCKDVVYGGGMRGRVVPALRRRSPKGGAALARRRWGGRPNEEGDQSDPHRRQRRGIEGLDLRTDTFGCTLSLQEHLSRHQQARHSTVKDFVCTVCTKGFARRDILRRHELGHAKAPGTSGSKTSDSRASSPKPSKSRGSTPNPTGGSSSASSAPTGGSSSSSSRIKRESMPSAKKRAAAQSELEDEMAPFSSGGQPGAQQPPQKKFQRVVRVCDGCTRMRTRCDGGDPCIKCRRADTLCTYGRDKAGSGPPSRASPSSDILSEEDTGSDLSSNQRDDVDEDDYDDHSPELVGSPHHVRNSLNVLTGATAVGSPYHDGSWSSVAANALPATSQPPTPHSFASSYSVPIRPPSAHQSHHGALPPSSFQQAPSPLGFGAPHATAHYYSRPPDSFLHRPQAGHYYGTATTPGGVGSGPSSPYLAHFPSNVSGAGQHPNPNVIGFAPSSPGPSASPFDTAAYGRTSTSNVNGSGGLLGSDAIGDAGFSDLITGASAETEINWDVLNATPLMVDAADLTANHHESYSDIRGSGDAVNGSSLLYSGSTRSIGSPGTVELEARLLGNSIQPQHSNMREEQSNNLLPLVALPFDEPEDQDASINGADTGATQTNESTPGSASSGAFHSGLNSAAAETLLQLASHTPRQSPEPESRFGPSASTSSVVAGTLLSNLRGTPPPQAPSALEEETRSSHLAHSSSDPWPLSYRPVQATEDLLPASARGTGYRSRAASPRPGAATAAGRHALSSIVPPLTAATRARVIAKVRSIGSQERFVPRLELLDLFLQYYFTHFESTLPILHRPTFDPNTCPSFLLLAVASVGARYAHERLLGADVWAQALLETARKMVQVVGDADNRMLQTVAWQQSLLIILLTGYVSGNKRDLERTQGSGSMPITYARRQGWFKEPHVDDSHERSFSLEERWKRWRDREEIKRLGFGALLFDSMGTAMWGRENSSLFVDAAKTSLPCRDALWEAKSAIEWQALFRSSSVPARSIDTLEAVKLVSTRSTHSDESLFAFSKDTFAMQVVLSILHSLGWSTQHQHYLMAMLLPDTSSSLAQSTEGAMASIEAGMDFVQDRVVMGSRTAGSSEAGKVPMTDPTLTLMLHLMAMSQRLPLRVLHVSVVRLIGSFESWVLTSAPCHDCQQPLARSGGSQPSPEILEAISTWFNASRGQVSRLTAYHAGQLFALQSPIDSPWEPFALFYAALTLVAFIREMREGFHQWGRGVELRRAFVLDKVRDRDDAELQQWIEGGEGGDAFVPHLEAIKGSSLLEADAVDKVLRMAGVALGALKVYKVGELLGKTLIELAKEYPSARGESIVPESTS